MSPAVREWLEAFNRMNTAEKREAIGAFRSRGRPSRSLDDIRDIDIDSGEGRTITADAPHVIRTVEEEEAAIEEVIRLLTAVVREQKSRESRGERWTHHEMMLFVSPIPRSSSPAATTPT